MRFATLLVLTLSCGVGPAAAQSVCAAEEEIVWSCVNQRSTYAVCASNDLSRISGYMQYRATKDGKSALTFPASLTHPAGLFDFSLLPRGAMLSFESGGYLYEMSEGLEGAPSIAVSKNGAYLGAVQCAYSDHTLTLTKTINLIKEAGVGD